MSSSSNEDIPIELSQEIREQRIIRRFDFGIEPYGPQRGAVILRAVGFGVVRIVGIKPNQARIGDIAVEVTHSGYFTRARVWLKATDGVSGWTCVEDLFADRDRLIQIEHSGFRSRIISWGVWRNKAGGWRFQQQSSDEQRFSTFTSDFEPLSPVHEGTQSEFGV
ncbi:unnamed protein product [Sphagnum jensenii]|uniref:Uncharacterized protein n=1 Tax=Sphagnum jensenii TaxID=128206 RepID=A0ABP1ABY8_9BRYO